ncbi:MAG: DUF4105 domain-containing protein [Prevotella sp.]|nr:DUF4105 domain-containing protein [Prevotella sp.]
MRRVVVILLQLVFCACGVHAQRNDSVTVAADSSNFVTASILILEPTNAIVSVFGHVAVRMECPSENLDYVFTLENNPNANAFTTGIMAKAPACYVAVPASVYINDAKSFKRGLVQYELNLNLQEKRELWRLLDENIANKNHGNFNLRTNSCLSVAIQAVQNCLAFDHFEWGEMKFPRTLCDGDFLRYSLQKAPWSEFIFVSFCGSLYGKHSPEENRMTPESIIGLLKDARFVDSASGEWRPVIAGDGVTIVKAEHEYRASFWSPLVVFGILFLLTLLVTAAQWMLKWDTTAHWFDLFLFSFQALIFALMLYVCLFSEIFGEVWNWYFIAFFPFPLVILIAGDRQNSPRWWLFYSCLLLLFVLSTPFIGVLDMPHQLITCSIMVRSFWRYLINLKRNVVVK